jgi:hypothetical protein
LEAQAVDQNSDDIKPTKSIDELNAADLEEKKKKKKEKKDKDKKLKNANLAVKFVNALTDIMS